MASGLLILNWSRHFGSVTLTATVWHHLNHKLIILTSVKQRTDGCFSWIKYISVKNMCVVIQPHRLTILPLSVVIQHYRLTILPLSVLLYSPTDWPFRYCLCSYTAVQIDRSATVCSYTALQIDHSAIVCVVIQPYKFIVPPLSVLSCRRHSNTTKHSNICS
jgi:hypothetical protein